MRWVKENKLKAALAGNLSKDAEGAWIAVVKSHHDQRDLVQLDGEFTVEDLKKIAAAAEAAGS